jgi:endonuclease YncB( thermonuclease family)
MSKILENCDPDTIDSFSIKGLYRARVCKVYDGDTCTCIFQYNDTSDKLYKFSIRLADINTPEIRTKDESEKKKAIQARDYLSSRILDKIVSLECNGFDKYGRILGRIFIDDHCINQEMVDKEYAVEYMKKEKKIEKESKEC